MADISGRPDGRLANYIYASGAGGVCRDMRYSAWGLTQEDFAAGDLAVKSGEYRGRELMERTVITGLGYFHISAGHRKLSTVNSDQGILGYGKQVVVIIKADDHEKQTWLYQNGSHTSLSWWQEHPDTPYSVFQLGLEGNTTYSDTEYLLMFRQYSDTSVSDEYTHTEVTGDPANILQCDDLKDGWVGSWNPTKFTDSSRTHPFTVPIAHNSTVTATFTRDVGQTWNINPDAPSVNYDSNSRITSEGTSTVMIYQYSTKAKLTTNSESTSFINVGDVIFSGSSTECRDLGFSLTDGIGKSTTSPSLNLSLTQVGINLDSGELSASKETRHTPISNESPTNDSPAFKALNYNVVENQQGFINYAYTELKHNGTDWGDDGEIHIANNQATRTDDNGNTVVYGTARIVEPIGWIKNDK